MTDFLGRLGRPQVTFASTALAELRMIWCFEDCYDFSRVFDDVMNDATSDWPVDVMVDAAHGRALMAGSTALSCCLHGRDMSSAG